MKGGTTTQPMVHLKTKENDFFVYVDDLEVYKKWQDDKSIPLAHFVARFDVFVTENGGTQGEFVTAPDRDMENDDEINTSNKDEAIKVILEKGSLHESSVSERQGPKNDSMGPMVAH